MRRHGWIAVAIVALGTNGCEGCDAGPATRYCQQQLDPIDASTLENCRSCCHQEVPYTATIESGRCVCHRP